MPAKKDYLGTRSGRLEVIQEVFNLGYPAWLCQCDCGNQKIVRSSGLRAGTSSCGCLHKESVIKRNKDYPCSNKTTHGKSKTTIYALWASMIKRCTNPNNHAYKYYGGRGIEVCDQWRHFENFYEDMGEKPEGKSLDRVDVNGNYCKENCRWADAKTQGRNKRNNRSITFNGETKLLCEWAEELGINTATLHTRLSSDWSIEDSLFIPVAKRFNSNE